MKHFKVWSGLSLAAAVAALVIAGGGLFDSVDAAAPHTGEEGPCYYAGVTLCCEFDRVCNNPDDPNDCHTVCARWVGSSRDGGNTAEECGYVLDSMLVDAAHNGCWTREPQCRPNKYRKTACEDRPDDPIPGGDWGNGG